MRYRDIVLRNIDQIEASITRVATTINQGNREEALNILDQLRDRLDQLKSYIEAEPVTGNEI